MLDSLMMHGLDPMRMKKYTIPIWQKMVVIGKTVYHYATSHTLSFQNNEIRGWQNEKVSLFGFTHNEQIDILNNIGAAEF